MIRSWKCPDLKKQERANMEKINHPEHYGADTTYEVIKVIEAWKMNFNLGSVLKYVGRAGKKSKETYLEDLQKAEFYLKREIATLKAQESPDFKPVDMNSGK